MKTFLKDELVKESVFSSVNKETAKGTSQRQSDDYGYTTERGETHATSMTHTIYGHGISNKSETHGSYSRTSRVKFTQYENNNGEIYHASGASATTRTGKYTYFESPTTRETINEYKSSINKTNSNSYSHIDGETGSNFNETITSTGSSDSAGYEIAIVSSPFTPTAITFRDSWVTSTCVASFVTTHAVFDGQNFVTSTVSVPAIQTVDVYTTVASTFPSQSIGLDMIVTELDEYDRQKKFQTEIIAEKNEKIGIYDSNKNITLYDSIILGAEVGDLATETNVSFTIQRRFNDYDNADDWYKTINFTRYSTTPDFNNQHTYFNTKNSQSSQGYYATRTSSQTAEQRIHTLNTIDSILIYGTSTDTTITGWENIVFNFSTNSTNQLIALGAIITNQKGVNRVTYNSSGTAENYASETTKITVERDYQATALPDYPEDGNLSLTAFGHGKTNLPLLQKKFGTGEEFYANLDGMRLPLVGANFGVNHNSVNKHYALGLQEKTPCVAYSQNHLYTRTIYQYNNGVLEQVPTTRLSARVIYSSAITYAKNLPIESVENAFKFSFTSYQKTTHSDSPDIDVWQQKTNDITAVTLATNANHFALQKFELNEKDEQDWVTTEYDINQPAHHLLNTINYAYRDSNNELVNWFHDSVMNHKYLQNKVIVVGGIDASGSPKTGYVQFASYKDQTFKMITKHGESVQVEIPITGKVFAGTAVSTIINEHLPTVHHGEGVYSGASVSPSFSLFYKEQDINWTNNNQVVHDWDLPVGASFGDGIITAVGQAPETIKHTLNSTAEESNFRTALRYAEPTLPQTIPKAEYESKIYETQNEHPYLGY